MLYLSLFFKTNRDKYYEFLQKVRIEGDWEGWLRFFLTGVNETAEQAVNTARAVLLLFEKDRQRIEGFGRAASSALRIHQILQKNPILSISKAAQAANMTYPTVAAALSNLQQQGLVRETTGKERHRLFVYDEYVRILSEGAEPLKENRSK